jgi:uncharacterized protein YbcC (UPF0753/DUF2309 family)
MRTMTIGTGQEDTPARPPRTAGLPEEAFAAIDAACASACRMIAPAWPLDRAIAVNPHWSRIGMPLRQVAARMAVLGDIQVFPSRVTQQLAWDTGRISATDLTHALATVAAAVAAGLTPEQCLQALQRRAAVAHLPLLIDVLDDDPARHGRLSWRQAITHQVSQTCAAYFDGSRPTGSPGSQGLYASGATPSRTTTASAC